MKTDVLIVGAGSVGLTLGNYLARFGVDSIIVEKSKQINPHPRAMGINGRTGESLRALGVFSDVARLCYDLEHRGYRRLTGDTLDSIDFTEYDTVDGLRNSNSAVSPGILPGTCPQPVLDRILTDSYVRHGGSIRYGVEFESATQTDEIVRARVRRGIDVQSIDAAFLIGADGARSAVRKSLKVPFPGSELGGPMSSVLFKADLSAITKNEPFVVCNVSSLGGAAGILPVNGRDSWIYVTELGGSKNDVLSNDSNTAKHWICTSIGHPIKDIKIVSVMNWRVQSHIADRFRDGRVLLIGDAAHVVPPVGALGLNTGIGDAQNLAWKIAQVLCDKTKSALLDSYNEERRPYAAMVRTQAELRYNNPSIHWTNAAAQERLSNAPVTIASDDIIYNFRYRSKAIYPPMIKGKDTCDDLDVTKAALPGKRLPHVWLTKCMSTLDQVTTRFVLFIHGSDSPWISAFREASKNFGIDLDIRDVGVPPFSSHNLTDVFGISTSGALLVRPDQVIAWKAGNSKVNNIKDITVRVLGALLCRSGLNQSHALVGSEDEIVQN